MATTVSPAWTNWSGIVTASPKAMLKPKDEAALSEAICSAPGPLRVKGSGHSFTPLVASEGTIIDVSLFSGLISHDPAACSARLGAGTTLHNLTKLLHEIGQALPNMGDIDAQTLGGALGTATHGSGTGLGAYHTLLSSIRLVDGTGNFRDYSLDHDQDMIHATGVTLGVFGILTTATLQNVPGYRLRRQRKVLSARDILQNFESIMGGHRSAEFFYIPYSGNVLLVASDLSDQAATTRPIEHDEDGLSTLRLLRNTLKWFPWARRKLIGSALEKLPPEDYVEEWIKIYASERRTKFNEMEYHLPFEEGAKAVGEIIALTETQFPEVYFPIEVRTVMADDFWLSPFYKRKSCSIAIHHGRENDPHGFFRAAEQIFRKYGGRPHWGKMHYLTSADLAAIYPRFKDAMEVRRDIDPGNRFISPYLAKLLGV
jgi:FAD-linked oxidoreductase